MNKSQQFLDQYTKERLPQLAPGMFENVPDEPSFTVDQGFQRLVDPQG